MIWLNYLSVVLPAAFSTIHALSLPIPLNQTLGSPFQLSSDWECSPIPFIHPPHYTDCEAAYNQLPQSSDQAIFHQMGLEDGYRLPAQILHKTCMLSVSLLGEGQQDQSSWAEIAFRAETLNHLCINGLNHGGYIKTGQKERIWIMLMSASTENRTVSGQLDVA